MSFSSASVRSLCAIAVSSVLLVAPANAAEPEPLPLQRVVAFTSGIAYFDHVGHVEGDQEVSLRFNVDDINDLLKSMVRATSMVDKWRRSLTKPVSRSLALCKRSRSI